MMLTSTVCRYEHFNADWYAKFAERLALEFYGIEPGANPRRPHRKAWEWCAISQALAERDMLRPGRHGAGFAVGREPLPAAFAAEGVHILATDQAATTDADMWVSTHQHAASLDALFRPELIERDAFNSRVRFRPVDMRNLELPWSEGFDFVWSSCSVGHLGGLQQGLYFILQSMQLVKPGGVAVHTTEFNVASNKVTLMEGDSVIYRRRDLEQLDGMLRSFGCGLSRCDFFAGDHPNDLDFDVPPYATTARQHIKLQIGGHVATSILLIIRKGLVPVQVAVTSK
jgi:SAM-dependent methyltransferase